MTYEELIFELKRLIDLAYPVDQGLAYDLQDVLVQYEEPKGDCCG